MIWLKLILIICGVCWPSAVSGKTTQDWLVLNHCHHDIQNSLDNIFNDLTVWCERIDVAQNTDQLAGDLATFKINVDMLFQFIINIPSQVDPQVYALEIVQYLQQTRNALYGVQGSVAQLGRTDSLISVDAKHCLDQLLETSVRVYRSVAVTLHAYVDTIQARGNAVAATQDISTETIVTVISGISRQIKELQRSVDVGVAVNSSAHAQSSTSSANAIDTVPDDTKLHLQRCADGSIDPDILRTSHSPPIDYQRLYATADWSDKYDDSAAAEAVRQEQKQRQQQKNQQHIDNTTIVASTEALLTHGHPVVIYSQNGFAHQMNRYRNRLNRRFHLIYTRLAAVCDDDSLAGTAIREHLDSVQTALNTIVQYTSRLTVAVVHSKLCPLTCNTGLRSIVLLVRQLMLTAETFTDQLLGSRDGQMAANEVFDIMVSVSRLVEIPLQRINELMDFVDGGVTESSLADHVSQTLNALVDSFRLLDAEQQCGRAPHWSADAVRTYILSLDEVLKNFRAMPGNGDVSQLELHTIRQSVSKVMRRMQHIHQDCAADGRMDSKLNRHLQRSVEHLAGIDEQLTNFASVDRIKGLGNQCVGLADENGDRLDRSSWHNQVAGNARQIVQAMSMFHGSSSSELVSTTTTTTTTTSSTDARAFTSAAAVTNFVGDL